jgi:GTP-binding protein
MSNAMEVKKAIYIISSPKMELCPAPTLPEVAFIGRSNVGKSSLINMLSNKRELAKVSSNPGKTQMINHFNINDNMFWVDLPGYGFAKVSQAMRKDWKKMIMDYLEKRENLATVFVLIDSRVTPQKHDIDFINTLGQKGIAFNIVFTKADKSKQTEVAHNVKTHLAALHKYWEELPKHFITSAEKRLGRKEMLGYMDEIIEEWEAKEKEEAKLKKSSK